MILKPNYACKTVKVITKQTRNHSELVCKMDNISIIKVNRVVIISMYVTFTETLKSSYNLYNNTLTASEEKNDLAGVSGN